MKRKWLTVCIWLFLVCSLSGCIYSHNYDRNGEEMTPSQAKEALDSIVGEIFSK